MRISKKAEYGLLALTALARSSSEKPMQIQEMGESEGIPIKFLEQILLRLKRAGILKSKRGVGGGYQLAREAGTVSVGEVIEVFDGPLSSESEGALTGKGCGLRHCFIELQQKVSDHLNSTTIADLVAAETPGTFLHFEI